MPKYKSIVLTIYFLIVSFNEIYDLLLLITGIVTVYIDELTIYSIAFTLLIMVMRSLLLTSVLNYSLHIKSIIKRIFMLAISLVLIVDAINLFVFYLSDIDISYFTPFHIIRNSPKTFIFLTVLSTVFSLFLNKELSWQETKISYRC
ncbi:hypothetical protein RB151_003800 [Providencia rettgeri]|nr:hypothetical protein RB151_003800 [Providencia rettgeri]AVL73735.1 hypothetical protein CEQ08_08330 [Providencia rettgeri]